jgi:HAD superfamily hydrolase (TIGR01509 family)
VIKALIFDFDGLIMDTETIEVDIWKAIYYEYGHEFPLQVWIRDVVGSGISNFDLAAHLASITGQSIDTAALHARARASLLQRLDMLSALPGVSDYINAAKQFGLHLAVASNSGHAWVEGYLRQLGLFEDFDVIVCREDVQRIKPDPELYQSVLDTLKVQANETVAFEDSPVGVLAARRAGIRVVAVPNQLTAQVTIEGASLVLVSLAELPLVDLLRTYSEN